MTSQNPSQTYPMPSPSVSTFTFPSTTEPLFTASTSEPVFESPNHSQTSQTTQSQQLQQYHTTTVSNNNAKFPYLKKEEYETWAMKMEYWIMNSDHNLWNIVLNGNSRKKTGRGHCGKLRECRELLVVAHTAGSFDPQDFNKKWSSQKLRRATIQVCQEEMFPLFHCSRVYLDEGSQVWNDDPAVQISALFCLGWTTLEFLEQRDPPASVLA
ncbi:hypothetical protein Tco_1213448 [Tanacetum coccineum]